MKRRTLLLAVLTLTASLTIFASRALYPYWVRVWYVLPTMDCMTSLMSALAVEQPYFVNADVLRTVGDKHGFVRCHADAWGNPFEVEYAPGADPPYRIISLGRDGKRGSCCRYLVEDVNEDAVRQGQEWL